MALVPTVRDCRTRRLHVKASHEQHWDKERLEAALLCVLAMLVFSAPALWWGYQASLYGQAGAASVRPALACHVAVSALLGIATYWVGRRHQLGGDALFRWRLLLPTITLILSAWITAWLAHQYGRFLMPFALLPFVTVNTGFQFYQASRRDRARTGNAEGERSSRSPSA